MKQAAVALTLALLASVLGTNFGYHVAVGEEKSYSSTAQNVQTQYAGLNTGVSGEENDDDSSKITPTVISSIGESLQNELEAISNGVLSALNSISRSPKRREHSPQTEYFAQPYQVQATTTVLPHSSAVRFPFGGPLAATQPVYPSPFTFFPANLVQGSILPNTALYTVKTSPMELIEQLPPPSWTEKYHIAKKEDLNVDASLLTPTAYSSGAQQFFYDNVNDYPFFGPHEELGSYEFSTGILSQFQTSNQKKYRSFNRDGTEFDPSVTDYYTTSQNVYAGSNIQNPSEKDYVVNNDLDLNVEQGKLSYSENAYPLDQAETTGASNEEDNCNPLTNSHSADLFPSTHDCKVSVKDEQSADGVNHSDGKVNHDDEVLDLDDKEYNNGEHSEIKTDNQHNDPSSNDLSKLNYFKCKNNVHTKYGDQNLISDAHETEHDPGNNEDEALVETEIPPQEYSLHNTLQLGSDSTLDHVDVSEPENVHQQDEQENEDSVVNSNTLQGNNFENYLQSQGPDDEQDLKDNSPSYSPDKTVDTNVEENNPTVQPSSNIDSLLILSSPQHQIANIISSLLGLSHNNVDYQIYTNGNAVSNDMHGGDQNAASGLYNSETYPQQLNGEQDDHNGVSFSDHSDGNEINSNIPTDVFSLVDNNSPNYSYNYGNGEVNDPGHVSYHEDEPVDDSYTIGNSPSLVVDAVETNNGFENEYSINQDTDDNAVDEMVELTEGSGSEQEREHSKYETSVNDLDSSGNTNNYELNYYYRKDDSHN